MELQQLRYFCEVVENESFSAAAKRLGVGVSNVTQMMKRFEAESGIALFERYPNRIRVSESGKKYYEEIKKALSILDDAGTTVADSMNQMSGNIDICIYTNRRIVTDAIEVYHAEYPEVTFTISHKINSLPQNKNRLDNDEVDYDIVIADYSCAEVLCNYDKELLLSEKILLATNNKNKILRNRRLTSKILATQNYITPAPGYSLYNYTNSICMAMGFIPKISIKCDDAVSVRKYIEMGFGVGFVPEISWNGQFSDKIVLRNIGDFQRDTYLYLKRYRHVPKRLQIFIEYLKKEFVKYSGIDI